MDLSDYEISRNLLEKLISIQQYYFNCFFRKHAPYTGFNSVSGFVRKETHTRFGAFLSTGIDVRPAPLTDEDPAIVFSKRRPHSLMLNAK